MSCSESLLEASMVSVLPPGILSPWLLPDFHVHVLDNQFQPDETTQVNQLQSMNQPYNNAIIHSHNKKQSFSFGTASSTRNNK